MLYAPSDFIETTVPADGRGCGQTHRRPTGPDGQPVDPFILDCPVCETYLRQVDDRWSSDPDEIRETYDERRHREVFLERGARDQQAIMALAMARMSGMGPAEIPASISNMLAGKRIAGQTVCPAGHYNTAGSRFCRECGTAMSVPATAGALGPGPSA